MALLAAALFAASGAILMGRDDEAVAPAPPTRAERQIPEEPSTIAAEKPPTPKDLDVAPVNPVYRGPAEQVKTPPELVGTPAEGMPAASAGDNGTHDRPSARVRQMLARTVPASGKEASGRAILLGRTALAPPGAPEPVKRAISAANEIVGRPYVWGGGHASWYSRGYDCSGAVSYALGGAGLLDAPLTSGGLANWGAPGPGRWITIYANAGHTYMVVAGLRWDTVGAQRGSGPRWHADLPYPEGYEVRHPVGL